MSPSPTNNNAKRDEQLFTRPAGVLLDEKQWLYLKDRYHLTPRELQVAILVCRGFSNDEITGTLRIKHGTVKTHLRNIYRRARVRSKILLLLRFIEDINMYYGPAAAAKPPIPITEKPRKPGVTPKIPQDK
jgi:DNA-binding NarL/FixJ family response regulator